MPRKPSPDNQAILLEAPPRGATYPIEDPPQPVHLHFKSRLGSLYLADSFLWLETLEPKSVDLIVADPPYSIKKADWDTFDGHDEYIEWSRRWIELASRALKPSGTMYVCGFSEILADIKVVSADYFNGCRWLVWHYKNKANLGRDWGRSHESIIHFRKSSEFTMNYDDVRIPYGAHTLKYPSHPQAVTSVFGQGKKREDDWTPNPNGAKPKDVFDIPTTCNGMGEKTPHPTQKPEELIRKLVLASSNSGDFVIDPFSGSGTTAVVCEQLSRRWACCDKSPEYNEWAIARLNTVPDRSVNDWILHDRNNLTRRESIR
jgi:site-specific DNA-methyltransferase (adenine-specific)